MYNAKPATPGVGTSAIAEQFRLASDGAICSSTIKMHSLCESETFSTLTTAVGSYTAVGVSQGVRMLFQQFRSSSAERAATHGRHDPDRPAHRLCCNTTAPHRQCRRIFDHGPGQGLCGQLAGRVCTGGVMLWCLSVGPHLLNRGGISRDNGVAAHSSAQAPTEKIALATCARGPTSASPGLDSAVQFRPLLLPRRLRYSRPAQRRVHQYKHVSTERRSALEAVKGGRRIGGNALFHVHFVLLRALLPQPCVHVHEELLHVERQAVHSTASSNRIPNRISAKHGRQRRQTGNLFQCFVVFASSAG